MKHIKLITRVTAIMLSSLTLAGCLTSASGEEETAVADPTPIETTNTAPSIAGTPETEVYTGASYEFTPSASDPDGDVLTFSIANLPAWAEFDSSTGRLSGVPGAGTEGTYSDITISVTDGAEKVSLDPFSITVLKTNTAPVISGTPATSVAAGSNYSFTPTASDADGDTLTFSIVNLPEFTSRACRSGAYSHNPCRSGTPALR